MSPINGVQQLKADYSGFERGTWVPRSNTQHKERAERVRRAKCLQEKKALEREYGLRYSALNELHYYQPIRHHCIDPMHCIFLGVCKRFTKTLYQREMLGDNDSKEIQKIIDLMQVPASIGRIPQKVGSTFSALTADEWKNWTLVYSSICLHDRLTPEIYQLWMVFVKAVSILCRRLLKSTDISLAEDLLWKFASSYETHFGKSECTPNLHLLCHLPEVVRDYGPVYAFWCYSFERSVVNIVNVRTLKNFTHRFSVRFDLLMLYN